MHEWTAYVCHTLSTAWEFWKYEAPLLAFEHRCILDGLHCLAALYIARPNTQDTICLGVTRADMPYIASIYFERALSGHQKMLTDLSLSNVEAAYVSCTCITLASLVTLRGEVEESRFLVNGFSQWLRLSRGMKFIVNKVRRKSYRNSCKQEDHYQIADTHSP